MVEVVEADRWEEIEVRDYAYVMAHGWEKTVTVFPEDTFERDNERRCDRFRYTLPSMTVGGKPETVEQEVFDSQVAMKWVITRVMRLPGRVFNPKEHDGKQSGEVSSRERIRASVEQACKDAADNSGK